MDIDKVGAFLEHQGLSDEAIDAYFEHHGVPGMKWGVRRAEARAAKGPDRFGNRNNLRVQRRLDRVSRVASGKASIGDMIKTGLFNVPLTNIISEGGLRGGSQHSLDQGAKIQKKVSVGKRNTTDMLLRLQGVDIRELNYGYTPAPA